MKKLALLFLLFPFLVGAQTLTGTVLDADSREPLIGANIFLKSDFSKGSQSNLEGHFQLNLPKVPDTIWISYIGYQDRWIAITEQQLRQPDTFLLKVNATTIEMVTVKAKKLVAEEFTVEQINKLDIWLNPAAKADPLLAIQSKPASTNSDESANISLRGSPPSRTGIFLNNVPLDDVVRFDQTNGIGQFSIFNTALISSVNVFPSNPPLEFGQATSGVVAIYTDDELPDNSNSIGLNLVGLSGMTSQHLSDQTAMVAYANFNTHHGLKALNPEGLSDLHRFQTLDGGLYLIHQFNPRFVLKYFNFTLLENYQFSVRSPSHNGLFQQRKNRNLSILNLTYRKDQWQWQLNQGFNWSRGSYQIGVNDLQLRNRKYHASWTGSYFWDKTSLKTGASFDAYHQHNLGIYARYDYAYGEGHPTEIFDTTTQNRLPEFFLYGKHQLSSNWTLGAGVRWHPAVMGLDAYQSLQGNLAYRPARGHSIILSAGQYESYLAPTEAFASISRVRSRQVALDYRWKKSNWQGSMAVYAKRDQETTRTNPVYGAEIYVERQGQKLSGSLSFASINSNYKEGSISYPTPFDMSYSLRAMLQYNFSGGLTLSGIFQLREGRYFQPLASASPHPTLKDIYIPRYRPVQEGARFPAYHRLDISASRIFATSFGSIIVYLNVNNLLDQQNIRNQNYNQDYSQSFYEYLSRRTLFFGAVCQF